MSHVHLHDCPAYTRIGELAYGKDHQPLGKGDLDVARFLNRLKEANYTGTIVFELTVAEALTSMQVVKNF